MQERNITVTLEKAKEWYNSGDATLKKLALQAFSEKELNVFDFTEIKTFKDALLCLYPFGSKGYTDVINNLKNIVPMSKASAAMFKLNIIRRALNNGYNLHLNKNAKGQEYIWYPYFRFITEGFSCYDNELRSNRIKKLGKIKSEEAVYTVVGGDADYGCYVGLGNFRSSYGVGFTDAGFGFLGCATKEIANHFGLHFGMLIMEAMYGDMVDFKIIE